MAAARGIIITVCLNHLPIFPQVSLMHAHKARPPNRADACSRKVHDTPALTMSPINILRDELAFCTNPSVTVSHPYSCSLRILRLILEVVRMFSRNSKGTINGFSAIQLHGDPTQSVLPH